MTRYTVTFASGTEAQFAADLSEASAPLCYVDDEGTEHATQWQTASARHDEWQAAELVFADELRDGDEIESVEAVDP